MKMEDLEGKRVKISAGTITVKDESGKTRGMVRGVRPFKSWNDRERFDNAKYLNRSGIWGIRIDGIIDNVILDGKEIYYLNDTRPLDNYEKMQDIFENSDFYENEVNHYNARRKIAENAAAAGMKVINCCVLN